MGLKEGILWGSCRLWCHLTVLRAWQSCLDHGLAAGVLSGHSTLLCCPEPSTCSWNISSTKTITSPAQLKASGPVSWGGTAWGGFQPFLLHRWIIVLQHMLGRAARVLVRMAAAVQGVMAVPLGTPLGAAAGSEGSG